MSTVEVLTAEQIADRRAAHLTALAAHRASWTAEQWREAAADYLLDARELALWSDFEDLGYLLGGDS